MAIRSDEITSIIRSEIKGFDEGADVSGVGTIVEVGDGIAQVYGLSGALAQELLEFPNGIMGMAFNLEEETVGALILGDYTSLKEGDQVKTTGRIVEVPVGDALIGRVVNPLGEPLDGKGKLDTTKTRPIERIAPGVIVRQPVDTPVQTGIKAIDSMIPIGRGQRELIIGDRQTGQDRHRDRHDHQPEGAEPHLHLRRHRPEAVDRGAGGRAARGVRRHGAHDRGVRGRQRSGPAPVPGPLRRRDHGRGVHGRRPRRPLRVRRPVEALVGLSAGLAAHAAPSRPRGVPRRHLLLALAPAGACGAAEQEERRRIVDRAADHRDAGRRRVGLHPDQRDQHHRRTDLPAVRPLQPGPAARRERGDQRLPRGRRRADQGHAPGGREAAHRPRPVPRARRVRPVQLGPRQGDPRPAHARREDDRDPEAAAVRAAPRREAGRHHLGGHQRPPRRRAHQQDRRVRVRPVSPPRVRVREDPADHREGEGALRRDGRDARKGARRVQAPGGLRRDRRRAPRCCSRNRGGGRRRR